MSRWDKINEKGEIFRSESDIPAASDNNKSKYNSNRYPIIFAFIIIFIFAIFVINYLKSNTSVSNYSTKESSGQNITYSRDINNNSALGSNEKERVIEFINDYQSISNEGNINRIMNLYDDQVDYFNKGIVDKSYIAIDKQNYYNRWPKVTNTTNGNIYIENADEKDIKTVSFVIDFQVDSYRRRERVTGKAQTTLKVKISNDVIRIISEKQTVIKRQKTIY